MSNSYLQLNGKLKIYTFIKGKGIVANIKRRKYKYGPKRILFETLVQSEVENAMSQMGYSSHDYNLSYGLIEEAKNIDNIKWKK